MDYFTHNARKSEPVKPSQAQPSRVSRDAYQLHVQRFTADQQKTAARLAANLTLA